MNQIFNNNLKAFINSIFYEYLYCLLKFIFLEKDMNKSEKIDSLLRKCNYKINSEIIKKTDKYITTEYSISNLNNILNFAKFQNKKFAGDILEAILIIIFSSTFKVDRDKTLEKYIFRNLSALRDSNNEDLESWIQKEKFKPDELKNLSQLLELEEKEEDIIYLSQKSPFINFLYKIFQLKYINIKELNNKNKTNKYTNNGNFICHKIIQKIFDSINNNTKRILEEDFKNNSISKIMSFLFQVENRIDKISLNLILKCFLISVFIFYQNENSPLMQYYRPKERINNNLVNIPFTYNLNDAVFEGRYARTALSPAKLSNICIMDLAKNNFREIGIMENSKNLLFNKNIKIMNNNSNLLKSYYIDFFNFEFGLFENDTLEELNLSHNYIKEDSEEYLTKLLLHFRGLKTINLSVNDLKNGLSSFFVVLKKLYRKNKIKLENLFLDNCLLDDGSFYELGELLKCKYCKLKRLYLSRNILPLNINFLKKLKLNHSLFEIHLNRNNIYNKDIKDIQRIISNTNLRQMYLYRNKILSFNEILNIVYRTKIIISNVEKAKLIDNKISLFNLDISNNDVFHINIEHIKLLIKIVEQTNLYCLDISHILYGPNPDSFFKNIIGNKINYKKKVDILKSIIENDKKKYYEVINNIKSNEIDIKRLNYLENEELLKYFDIKEINNIIKDQKSKLTIFLKQRAKEMILNLKENEINNKHIINKIYNNDKKINKEEYKNIESKLVNYMILKRAKENLIQLNKNRDEKKLIII